MNAGLQYIRGVRMGSRVEGVLAVAVLAAGFAACGSDSADYRNKPRPPAPISATVAIDGKKVRVSPSTFGGGPVVFIISNQSGAARKVTFETDELGAAHGGIRSSTGTIGARSTGELKVDAPEGSYTLGASGGGITPANVEVSAERRSAQNDLLLP
jgi:hypothetical protein